MLEFHQLLDYLLLVTVVMAIGVQHLNLSIANSTKTVI